MWRRILQKGALARWPITTAGVPCVDECALEDAGVEMFKKSLSQGQAGDNVGLLVRGVKRDDVLRGQVACKPGTVKANNKCAESFS